MGGDWESIGEPHCRLSLRESCATFAERKATVLVSVLYSVVFYGFCFGLPGTTGVSSEFPHSPQLA